MRMHSSLSPLLFGLMLSGLAVAQVPVGNVQRADLAEQIRIDAAHFQRSQPLPAHPNNGDEQRYPSRFASYSKGLPHDSTGTVDPTAYQKMLFALGTGNPADFEAIPLGATRKLVNPQSAYSFTLVGPDPHALAIRPAPAYASAETAGEMEELYWMSLVRDVDFYQYPTSAVTVAAAQRLNELLHYRGAKADGARVAANLLFRADVGGALKGPFISQFLLKPIPYGAGPLASGPREPVGYQLLEQRNLERRRGDDRMTQYAEWLNIQNGQVPTLNGGLIDELEGTDSTRLYLHNARGLAEYVHNDYPIQATLSAALLLLRQGDFLPDGSYEPDPKSSPLAMASWNPYLSYGKQEAFVTLGNSDTLSVSMLVTNTALRAAWYQKWLVHRRLRPEEFGGHVDNQLFNRRIYPIHPELLTSPVLARVFSNNTALNNQRGLPGGGTYLLSQAFPEGAPLHPAYGSGHSAYIGAGVTMLKAFHKNFPIRNPQETSNGSGLQPYTGGTLMVFDELDKPSRPPPTNRWWAASASSSTVPRPPTTACPTRWGCPSAWASTRCMPLHTVEPVPPAWGASRSPSASPCRTSSDRGGGFRCVEHQRRLPGGHPRRAGGRAAESGDSQAAQRAQDPRGSMRGSRYWQTELSSRPYRLTSSGGAESRSRRAFTWQRGSAGVKWM
ncbi:hypothetical protein [Cystobacter fuscus]|uniref:hypothetical protein n=1 Tax=Cystobacter fuscus TaxID=43 RepID=UPI0012DE45BB|nr:hypothetical protein [Cystobacter fuscus]